MMVEVIKVMDSRCVGFWRNTGAKRSLLVGSFKVRA